MYTHIAPVEHHTFNPSQMYIYEYVYMLTFMNIYTHMYIYITIYV